MIPYRIYKHINNTDVAIVPLKSFYVKEKEIWKLTVRWIYYKRDGAYQEDMNINQKITLTKKAALDWKYKGRLNLILS